MDDFWRSLKQWFKRHKRIVPFILVFIILTCAGLIIERPAKPTVVSYVQFQQMVTKKEVKSVNINLNAPTFQFESTAKKEYKTDNPRTPTFKEYLLNHNVKVTEITNQQSTLMGLFVYFVRLLMILIAFKIGMDLMSNNRSLTKSDAVKDKVPKVNFSQIAGNEEAKEEMEFLVEFLKTPQKFSDVGAKLPKGVVLYGPPGTGKTLTAKAIAGEAGVPFFSISGSDFVEMYVGLGAKRVRDLFKAARKKAPCIIFIDEIDAVGTKRGNDHNSEKDQTINALLNELDGFSGTEGIIVICATNRIEDLDNALIRPGRFDKHIAINLPDQKDRLEIIRVHTRNKQISEDVNIPELAKLTIGFSGASLEALINEATILAVTRNRKIVTKEDMDDAYFKMVMQGHRKKNQQDRKEEELELVAWHEAGHALASKLLTDNEVPKVTIVSSTNGTGGVTFITPKKMGLLSKREVINNIKVLYAGRVAEYLLLGDEDKITTGASSDIDKATDQLKSMITTYGMSEAFGMVQVSAFRADDEILAEATKLSKQLYQETVELLAKNKHTLAEIAQNLREKESLSEVELDAIVDHCKAAIV